MQRTITLLAVCSAAACVASAPPPRDVRAEPPEPTLASAPAARIGADLSGAWATGSTDEPTVKRIVVHEQCNYTPSRWITQQNGDTLRAWKFPASQAQGVRSTDPGISSVPAIGRFHGYELIMGTADARYVLHYDTTSGHLRGTFNGTPFWAVPLDIVRPEVCLPVP